MTFWEEHAEREAAHEEAERAKAPPSSQNAPARCDCGHVGPDVLFGICGDCAYEWENR